MTHLHQTCLRNLLYRSLFVVSLASVFHGCTSSPPILKLPEPKPAIVRTYKHMDISAIRWTYKGTGVYLDKGALYTILVKGTYPKNRLLMRIGKDRIWSMPIHQTRKAEFSGEVYLKVRKVNAQYKQGGFSIDIIVWSNDDYIKVAEFLKEATENNPQDYSLQNAYMDARLYSNLFTAEIQTKKDIENAKQALLDIKEKSAAQSKTDTPAVDQRVLDLEAKLASLTATLAELDKMKQELGIARQETVQLSQQLEEKEIREKQLLDQIASGTTNPPILLINSPADGLQTESKTVRLFGTTKDDKGLKQLNIFVNNRLVDDGGGRGVQIAKEVYPRRMDIDRRIPLEKGENRIKIHVIDTDGLFAERTLTVHHIERRHNVWAVVIGINAYPRVRQLKYAVNDARAIYDLLVKTNQIPSENVFLMVNGQASLKQLRSTLGTRLKNKAGKDDMVIIYFAGHGATERDMMSPDGDGLEKYLLPYDADPNDLYASALPMREIAHIFHRIRSERLIFIADACYSGASGGRTVSISGVRANISDAFLERIAGGKGKVIITASSASEVSVEKDELRHGVFTYYMVEGLRGKADTDQNGLITVDEAYRYVSDKVPQATEQEQHPVKKGVVEGQMVLGVVQ